MSRSPKIAVVGSYNVAFTLLCPRIPVIGETILGTDFSEGPGGKGSNQAIAAARLGAQVSFVGMVGRDRFGESAIELWKGEGIDITQVRRISESHTGVAVIVLDSKRDNAIVVVPGANSLLTPSDIEKAEDLIATSDVLIAQLEINHRAALKALDLARKHDVYAILNPAPARKLSPAFYKAADLMTPNESELRILLGMAPDAPLDMESGARVILKKGLNAVVVTCGEKGAQLIEMHRWVKVPAPKVDVVDVTGAGDAFNGALAVAIGEGRELKEAVSYGCDAGALAVTKMEVIPALPYRKELDSFFLRSISS